MSLLIAGYTPFSTVDYPGRTAAVVFTQGCPWRCRYCQNPSLQPLEAPQGAPAWEEFLEWLETRRGLLDAVVFSGGEPTMHGHFLWRAMADVLQRGFKIGLHTNGMFPTTMRLIEGYCDWVGLDIKAPMHKYWEVIGLPLEKADSCFGVLYWFAMNWHTAFEIRTTYHPDILSTDDLCGIAAAIQGVVGRNTSLSGWVIQRFQPNSPDPELNAAGPAVVSAELLEQLRSVAPNLNISVR